MHSRDIYTKMFLAVLFKIGKNLKQSKYPKLEKQLITVCSKDGIWCKRENSSSLCLIEIFVSPLFSVFLVSSLDLMAGILEAIFLLEENLKMKAAHYELQSIHISQGPWWSWKCHELLTSSICDMRESLPLCF